MKNEYSLERIMSVRRSISRLYEKNFKELDKYWKENVYWINNDFEEKRESLFEFGNRNVKDKMFGVVIPVVDNTREYMRLLKIENDLASASKWWGDLLNEHLGYNDIKYREELRKEKIYKKDA